MRPQRPTLALLGKWLLGAGVAIAIAGWAIFDGTLDNNVLLGLTMFFGGVATSLVGGGLFLWGAPTHDTLRRRGRALAFLGAFLLASSVFVWFVLLIAFSESVSSLVGVVAIADLLAFAAGLLLLPCGLVMWLIGTVKSDGRKPWSLIR